MANITAPLLAAKQAANAKIPETLDLSNPLIYQALADGMEILHDIKAHLKKVDWDNDAPCESCQRKGYDPVACGKILTYVTKAIDQVARLVELLKGNADQRVATDGGQLQDLLRLLTQDQFNVVVGWMEENESGAKPTLN